MYKIRKLKSFEGHEGLGFNCELVRDNKPVAYAINDASGGGVDFRWYDNAQPKVDINTYDHQGKPHTYKGTPEEKLFVMQANKFFYEFMGSQHRHNAETYIEGLIDDYTLDRRFKRLSRTRTIFRLMEDKPDAWRTLDKPYNPHMAKYLDNKYGRGKYILWVSVCGS